jgi:anti-anti-sigma factor
MEEIQFPVPQELTIYNVSEVKTDILDKLKKLNNLSNANLVFNCEQLEVIDAAGIQLLLSTAKTSLQEEFSVLLENVATEIKDDLELAGVKEILVKEEKVDGE